jgi:hypothetical protein
MSGVRLSGLSVVLIAGFVLPWAIFDTTHGEPERVIKVTAADLGAGRVIVIGRLGIPLRTMASVRGKWKPSDSDKDPGLRFFVSHVNHKALTEPVEFHRALVEVLKVDGQNREEMKPSAGEEWELRAFETGGFRGQPGEYWEELGGGTPQYPIWFKDQFVTTLDGILQSPGKPPQKPTRNSKR